MDAEISLITVGRFISECASICKSVLVHQVVDASGERDFLLFALIFLNRVQRLQKSVQRFVVSCKGWIRPPRLMHPEQRE